MEEPPLSGRITPIEDDEAAIPQVVPRLVVGILVFVLGIAFANLEVAIACVVLVQLVIQLARSQLGEEHPEWFGVPTMISALVFIAGLTVTDNLFGALLGAIGILLLFLAIGLLFTMASRS